MPRHRFALLVAPLLFSLAAEAKPEAPPRPTIVVAPLASSSAEEHAWIGEALSEALSQRLLASGEASVFSQRQWAAVLRERDIAARDIANADDARAVGAQLGADQLVIGSYEARWPKVRIQARRIPLGGDVALATAEVEGRIEDLPVLEQKLARALFGKAFQKAARKKPPTRDVYAWYHLSRCRDALSLQPLGPRAEPRLPKPLVKEALRHCERAQERDRRLAEAQSFEALARLLLGDAKKAKALAERARKGAEPGWPDVVAAFISQEVGDAEGALKILRRAAKRAPGFLFAKTTLAEALLEAGKVDDAIAVLEGSLKQAPKQPWALVLLGKAQAKKGDIDAALATTDKALALVPGDAVLLLEKASRQIDGGRWDDAEKTLREAMDKNPRLAAAYLRLGYVYLETQKLDLAGPILEKAVVEADLESERRIKGYAHYDLAKLAARQGDQARALEQLRAAVQAGFAERARFEGDPDLAEVVKDPAFAAIFEGPSEPSPEKAPRDG